MRLKKRAARRHVPFVDHAIADRQRHASRLRRPPSACSRRRARAARLGPVPDVGDALRRALLLGNVQRFWREMPSGFGKPSGRRIDRHQIDDVGTNAADERLARKHPAVVRVRRGGSTDRPARDRRAPDPTRNHTGARAAAAPVRGELDRLAHHRRRQNLRADISASRARARTADACRRQRPASLDTTLLQIVDGRVCRARVLASTPSQPAASRSSDATTIAALPNAAAFVPADGQASDDEITDGGHERQRVPAVRSPAR